MKRFMLLLFVFMFGSLGTAQADFMDYIYEMRGDTAVVKDLIDMDGESNSLIDAIELDEDADENRVYMLKRGSEGFPSLYLQDRSITLPSDRPTTIVGEYAPMVGGTAEDQRPPLIAGTVDAQGDPINFQMMIVQNDLTVKNAAAMTAATDGSQGWFFFEVTSDDRNVHFENVLHEHNIWTFIQSNAASGTSLNIHDSYFVNMSGHSCRRNGGIYDSENHPLEELVVENTTHVHGAGMLYKFRNHPPNRVFINQNTFVNITGQLLTTFGYESNVIVSNNLFVNSNIQAYAPSLDGNETDQDNLPHGIINVNHLPEGIDVDDADRKYLVVDNAVYWDDRLDAIVEDLNADGIDCGDCNDPEYQTSPEWMTQMITMNSRTQEMFDNNDQYPLMNEARWHEGNPEFADDGGLMSQEIMDDIIAWAYNAVRADNEYEMGKWRHPDNPAEDNWINFDWPVAADLSYSNSAFLTAAYGNERDYPVGDLNWFPEEKAAWAAERDVLHNMLVTTQESGIETSVDELAGQETPSSIALGQNYPNPFNPTTLIHFEIDSDMDVRLEVYNTVGQHVATLVNGHRQKGTHSVNFDASGLASGTYMYRLTAGDHVMTRSMTLIK